MNTETGEEKETDFVRQVSVMNADKLSEISLKASGLDGMEKGISLTTTYKEFSKAGEKTRGVFMGMKSLNKKDENGSLIPLPAVGWMESNGEIFVNAGSNLVGQLAGVAPMTAVEIEFVKEEKVQSGGKVKVYKVTLLK